MPTAVNVDVTTGTADIEKVLVDRKPIYSGVDVLLDQVNPSRVVYQPLKNGITLNDILKVAVFFVVCVRFRFPATSLTLSLSST